MEHLFNKAGHWLKDANSQKQIGEKVAVPVAGQWGVWCVCKSSV